VIVIPSALPTIGPFQFPIPGTNPKPEPTSTGTKTKTKWTFPLNQARDGLSDQDLNN